MSKVEIIKIKEDYYSQAFKIIHDTFKQCNSHEGTSEAVNNYLEYYNPDNATFDKMNKSFQNTPLCYILLNEDKVIGVIRGRKDRIINLFVNPFYHGNGYGELLLKTFENEALLLGSKKIKIKASLYAIEFYKKYNYKKTTGVRNFLDLKIQPMQKILNS